MAKNRVIWFSISMFDDSAEKLRSVSPANPEFHKIFAELELAQLKSIQTQLKRIDLKELEIRSINSFRSDGARYYIRIEIPGKNEEQLCSCLDYDYWSDSWFTNPLFCKLRNAPKHPMTRINIPALIAETEERVKSYQIGVS